MGRARGRSGTRPSSRWRDPPHLNHDMAIVCYCFVSPACTDTSRRLLTSGGQLIAAPGKAQGLLDTLSRAQAYAEKYEPGCLSYSISQDPNDPHKICAYEVYVSPSASSLARPIARLTVPLRTSRSRRRRWRHTSKRRCPRRTWLTTRREDWQHRWRRWTSGCTRTIAGRSKMQQELQFCARSEERRPRAKRSSGSRPAERGGS